MAREKISQRTYESWGDVLYTMYFKHNMSRSQVLATFGGELTPWVFEQTVCRLKEDRPDDAYIAAKAVGVRTLDEARANFRRARLILDHFLDKPSDA